MEKNKNTIFSRLINLFKHDEPIIQDPPKAQRTFPIKNTTIAYKPVPKKPVRKPRKKVKVGPDPEPIDYPTEPNEFTTKQYVDAITADDIDSVGSYSWEELRYPTDFPLELPEDFEEVHFIQLDGVIPSNATMLQAIGRVKFIGETFPNYIYQQLCISPTVPSDNNALEICNAGEAGPGEFINEFEYTIQAFDELKNAENLYLIHGVYGETYSIEIQDLTIRYRIPNSRGIISVQTNIDDIKENLEDIETRLGYLPEPMDLQNTLFNKANKYPFVLQHIAKGGPMHNLIINALVVADGPTENWTITSRNDEYQLVCDWDDGLSLKYITPYDELGLDIIYGGNIMFPNYTIPDEWEADTITGAVPSQLFSVLYDLKEIIELIGQWKDLSREATSLVDAINQSVVANPDITAGTKTKITYDEKGLVTAGEDVTWSDVTNKPLLLEVVNLTPAGDNIDSVLILHSLDNTSTGLDSYSIGLIDFMRSNGYGITPISIKYTSEKIFNLAIAAINILTSLTNTFIPKTFIYNGIKYIGIKIPINGTYNYNRVQITGKWTYTPIIIGYYNNTTLTVVNQEIYDSLSDQGYSYKSSYLNGKEIMSSGLLAKNLVLASSVDTDATIPTFRALTLYDIPSLKYTPTFNYLSGGLEIGYFLVGSVDTPAIVGSSDRGRTVLLVSGLAHMDNTYNSTLLLDISTRNSINIRGEIFSTMYFNNKVGYVTNTATNKVEIWIKSTNYPLKTTYNILTSSSDFELGNTKVTTEPEGITYISLLKVVTYSIDTSLAFLVDFPEVYGVEWDDTVESPLLKRIGNMNLHRTLPVQSEMERLLLKDNGQVNYLLAVNNSTLKKHNNSPADLTDADGMVMVRLPRHYRSFQKTGNTNRIFISKYPFPGSMEIKESFRSAYEAALNRSSGKLASVVNPATNYRGGNNQDWDTFDCSLLGKPVSYKDLPFGRNAASLRGPGWTVDTYDALLTTHVLYLVEYANRNCQDDFYLDTDVNGFKRGGLGLGVTTLTSDEWNRYNGYYPCVRCGATNLLGNNTGVSPYHIEYNGTVKDFNVPSYRGIENPFGHIWSFVDGCKVNVTDDNNGTRSEFYTCSDPTKFNDLNYNGYLFKGLLPRSEGYIKTMMFGENVPATLGGDTNKYWCDYYYRNNSTAQRALLFGGAANYGALAGFGCSNSYNAASLVSTAVGFRVCFLP